jgi:hypothetical protein
MADPSPDIRENDPPVRRPLPQALPPPRPLPKPAISDIREKMAVILMFQLLDLIGQSGVDGREAHSALAGAAALLDQVPLRDPSTHVIDT